MRSLYCVSMYCSSCVLSFFFFFQAEDGIRDLTVTGVQTCALPISFLKGTAAAPPLIRQALHSPAGNPWTEMGVDLGADGALGDVGDVPLGTSRSEERRVGKECRSRWSPYH